ncbi:NnrS family protein [Pelagibius marinus]|uniref:NnrS family protein n=1 Tax=Pelagibius marinus TaxID=2762760 RepID=UPI001872ED5F|nr:NnrS family protein [Pelagibius marinus]
MTKSDEPVPPSTAGPALLRAGFRVFFLAAGVWAVVAVAIWLCVFQAAAALPTAFDYTAWHAHEMVFGYAAAVIAGFLLTAIPNWTGRPLLQGLPLALLFGAWIAGRAAAAGSAITGPLAAAAVDLAFLVLLFAVALREILAGRNWRNLPMPLALVLLIVANVLMHLQAAGLAETGGLGQRLGIGVVVLLINLIGGRVIPNFTRNWLARTNAAALPAGFGHFDRLSLLTTAAGLGLWVFLPEHPLTGGVLLAAGGLNLARLARWQGLRTLAEPLVWSLHLGFAWVPLGLALLGLGVLLPEVLAPTAGLHALTAGAIGGMTVAVMTRATLGHSGRPLTGDGWSAAIYLGVAASAALRAAAPLAGSAYVTLLWASGLLWVAAFGLFVLRYGRLHLAD